MPPRTPDERDTTPVSELRLDVWTMPGAELGPENPLPPLAPPTDLHTEVPMDPEIPAEDQKWLGFGNVSNCLPYRIQDGYTREKRERGFRAAILENETLRATFLLDLGGRLWSLLHKPSGRELLDCNPVWQPASLAIRNAWFSGGVEWNIGMVGHCVFTCAPLFAARTSLGDGTPVLRLYEWERIRQVPFQIDAWLPDGSPTLFLRVRIVNPHQETVPMYWWSNIAVPETPQTRVIAPADHAYSFAYQGGLRRVNVPVHEGETDGTYPTRVGHSMDFFYRIPEGTRPFITALDEEGRGLGQTSTSLLKGRKLFLWGNGPGGKRWQSFLAKPGQAYIEIQAGLARTQGEHLPMPAGAEWEWLEAYGLVEADPALAHGADWEAARAEAAARIEALAPASTLDALLAETAAMARSEPAKLLHRGSGWGALEQARRATAGEAPFAGPELPFPADALGPEEEPWRALLASQVFPSADGALAPSSYMVQPEWRALLEQSVAEGCADHAAGWLHLGVMRHWAGEREAAREAWERSRAHEETPWVLRNLALLAREDDCPAEAADLLLRAARMRLDLVPLLVECARALLAAGRPTEWLDLLSEVPEPARSRGRIRLLEGQAALATGDLRTVEAIIGEAREVDDLREGEVSLSDLWYGLHEQRLAKEEALPIDEDLKARVRRDLPPPAEIDFRMFT